MLLSLTKFNQMPSDSGITRLHIFFFHINSAYQDSEEFADNQNKFFVIWYADHSNLMEAPHQMAQLEIDDDKTLPNGVRKQVATHKSDIQ